MLLAAIIGNIGKDAETKQINGKDYISFSVASTEKNGEHESTTWVSVLTSNNTNLLPFLKKGQQVFVSGRLKAGIYQNNNSFGIDLSVFAQTLQLCGGKKEESTTSNQASVAPSVGTNAVPSSSTAKPATVPDPSLTAFGNYAQENMTSPFPPPVDENGNAKSDDLPF